MDGRESYPSKRTTDMGGRQNKRQELDQDYLPVRAKLLEIAASLDRLDRAAGDPADDKRREQLRAGIELLLSQRAGRAEQIQLLFSREYAENWREEFFPGGDA